MQTDDVLNEVSRAFWLESVKRQIQTMEDVEGLRQICVALLQTNCSLKTMLQKTIYEQLHG